MGRRSLHIICGVAVLFASVTYAHVFHHFFIVHHPTMTAVVIVSMILAGVAGIFSFVGGYLLLTGGRRQNVN